MVFLGFRFGEHIYFDGPKDNKVYVHSAYIWHVMSLPLILQYYFKGGNVFEHFKVIKVNKELYVEREMKRKTHGTQQQEEKEST